MNGRDDPSVDAAQPLARLIAFYERLQPAALDRLAEHYTEDAYFKDPFNEVRGLAPIRAIFAHMFATLHGPRFVVMDRMTDGELAFLTWELRFRRRTGDLHETVIRGASMLRFARDGRVALHRDYWDAAEELYAKLPVLGALMRWLKRRLQVKATR